MSVYKENQDNIVSCADTNISPTNINEDDDEVVKNKVKKRIKPFSDSESDDEPLNNSNIYSNNSQHTDVVSNIIIPKTKSLTNESSSESEEDNTIRRINKKSNLSRIENKKKILHTKLKKLHRRGKEEKVNKKDNSNSHSSSDISDNEGSHRFEQHILNEETSATNYTSICDPDISDEEDNTIDIRKIKMKSKSTPAECKPSRMSAKQAMENMQKIKSESNRMLREKDVTLPYHRPKALSLKDIMSRRKPAVTSDGKSLPIKMNNEQLKHYVTLLEQRQKEMIELCKSDTEDEDDEKKDLDDKGTENSKELQDNIEKKNESVESLSNANDMSFDEIVSEVIKETHTTLENDSKQEQLVEISQEQSNKEPSNEKVMLDEAVAGTTIREQSVSFEEHTNKESFVEKDVLAVSLAASQTKLSVSFEENVNKAPAVEENILTEADISNEKIMPENKTMPEDSQLISLYYGSEQPMNENQTKDQINENNLTKDQSAEKIMAINTEQKSSDEFSDSEINYYDIDAMIESAAILNDSKSLPEAVNPPNSSNTNPKLTGTPGMIISLDGDDQENVNKTGVELLKERFTYFSKLQNQEDMRKDREKQ
ncbi:unnamed protein product [Leptidea sinapis]|uniref:Uncharacterized protein n=1 Tax=Leptidea sinapis TaxID=189913 RepID=A0A5E4QV57_9NEOP|nr:unnamed protein product [Leptidea sinapis]